MRSLKSFFYCYWESLCGVSMQVQVYSETASRCPPRHKMAVTGRPLSLRGLSLGWLWLLSLLVAVSPRQLGLAAPSNEQHVGESSTTAAATSQGVQGTVSGGSSRNPQINDLATVQDLAEMQAVGFFLCLRFSLAFSRPSLCCLRERRRTRETGSRRCALCCVPFPQDLKELNRLLKELGMTFYLEQSRDMTMFMPVDTAFAQLPFNIHELSWQAKWRIVQFHIIPNDVVDLDNALQDKQETQFDSWEGAPLKVSKVIPDNSHSQGVASPEFIVNGEAKIVSKPPKIETFNGASYKINKASLNPKP